MITRLENKNYISYIINPNQIQKYKHIYVESGFNEISIDIIYRRLRTIWNTYEEKVSDFNGNRLRYLQADFIYKNIEEFIDNFNIKEFENIYFATKGLCNKNNINNYLNMHNILYINKYQISWDYFFLESNKIYGSFYKKRGAEDERTGTLPL